MQRFFQRLFVKDKPGGDCYLKGAANKCIDDTAKHLLSSPTCSDLTHRSGAYHLTKD